MLESFLKNKFHQTSRDGVRGDKEGWRRQVAVEVMEDTVQGLAPSSGNGLKYPQRAVEYFAFMYSICSWVFVKTNQNQNMTVIFLSLSQD